MRYEVRNPTGELIGLAYLDFEQYGDRPYIEMPVLEPLDCVGIAGDRPWNRAEESMVCHTVTFKQVPIHWAHGQFKNRLPGLVVERGYIHLLRKQSWFKAL